MLDTVIAIATPVQAIPLSELSVQATSQLTVVLIRNAIREKRYDEAYSLCGRDEVDLALVFRTRAGEGISALPTGDVPYLPTEDVPHVWQFIDQYHAKKPELAQYYSLKNRQGHNCLEHKVHMQIFKCWTHTSKNVPYGRDLTKDIEFIQNAEPTFDLSLSPQFISRHYLCIVNFIVNTHLEGETWDQILQTQQQRVDQTTISDNALEYTLLVGCPKDKRYPTTYCRMTYRQECKEMAFQLLLDKRFDSKSLNTNTISFNSLMQFMEWAQWKYNPARIAQLAQQHPRISQIIETQKRNTEQQSFCVKNRTPLLVSIVPSGFMGLMVSAAFLHVPDPSIIILPTEFWIIAGIILASMVIMPGAIWYFNRKNIKSLEKKLEIQDQELLLKSADTAQSLSLRERKATSLTHNTAPFAKKPNSSAEQAPQAATGRCQ